MLFFRDFFFFDPSIYHQFLQDKLLKKSDSPFIKTNRHYSISMTDHKPPSPWGPRPDHRPDHRPDNGSNRNSDKNFERPQRPVKSRFSLFVIGMVAFIVILIIAATLMPRHNIDMSGLIYDGLLLTFIGAGLWAHVASSPGRALRHMAAWVIIFGVLALGYSIWTGGGRLGGEFNVAQGVDEGSSISFRADVSGHFFVRAHVNNMPIVFMVDTGATDVALTRKDAEKIGFSVDQLRYNMPYDTANGTAYGARVRLDNITIGPITARNISGSVLPDGLNFSLLGMSFLNSLSGYKVESGVLTLYP